MMLVTGGAGYIGSHVARLLADRGDEVVVVDDFSTGLPHRNPDLPVEQLDLTDAGAAERLVGIMRTRRIETVFHFAALKRVGDSVAEPTRYYGKNIAGLAAVLEAMREAEVGRLVFSSSAAVYGANHGAGIREDDATEPINPYGATKLIGEWMVRDAVAATGATATCLRYFNVAGAGDPALGDVAVLNLVPMVFERLDAGLPPRVFGADYPTPDGTCVRDYVHVLDLAEAHIAAADAMGVGEGTRVYNVGTGRGTSVLEMIAAIERVSGIAIEPEIAPRRAGDPAEVVASAERIERELGWRARRGLEEIVESAWAAWSAHPRG